MSTRPDFDQLARALAQSTGVQLHDDGIKYECPHCKRTGYDDLGLDINHTADCPFVWATEHVAALERQ